MKVVLIKDVDGLGKTGDFKDVKPGYARNFLFMKSMAVLPNDKQAKEMNRVQSSKNQTRSAKISNLEENINQLDGKKFIFPVLVNKKGLPFRAIHPKDIARKLGIQEELVSGHTFKSLGDHEIMIKFKSASSNVTITLEAKSDKIK